MLIIQQLDFPKGMQALEQSTLSTGSLQHVKPEIQGNDTLTHCSVGSIAETRAELLCKDVLHASARFKTHANAAKCEHDSFRGDSDVKADRLYKEKLLEHVWSDWVN